MPSFLSLDTDGRVMRIDSFSKIMAPGMRLGWVTSNPAFHDALVTYTDSSTMHPHGFGQALIVEMLWGAGGWRLDGFDRWVRSLRAEYHRRRAHFLSLFARHVAPSGLARASPPEAGMFVWIRVELERHPRYRADVAPSGPAAPRTNVAELMEELFERCLDAGVVVMPASIFATPASPGAAKLLGGTLDVGHLGLQAFDLQRGALDGARAAFMGCEGIGVLLAKLSELLLGGVLDGH